ncbi:hypothetical protein GCM10010182_17520 [Actinomadura cremea]|nr:hypothetical protein GCM10010182_17520 [Actinomadura cremea]
MDHSEGDRLLDTATRLFAELGYDGTSLQLIADAAGVDVAAVSEYGDGKAGLYRAVMRHVLAAERERLQPALDEWTPDLAGYLREVDAYLDFYVEHPIVMMLWLQRWLGDAADVPGLEEDFTTPLSLWTVEQLSPLIASDIDPDYVVWTVVWCVFGFLSGGMVYTDLKTRTQRMRGHGDERREREAVESFREHLHKLIGCMFAPPS